MSFSSDRTTLASAGKNSSVKLWSLDDAKVEATELDKLLASRLRAIVAGSETTCNTIPGLSAIGICPKKLTIDIYWQFPETGFA